MAAHAGRDLRTLDVIDLDASYRARDLLNLLRARTFRPFPAAHFVDEHGWKVYVRPELEYGEDAPRCR